jgi:3-phenylpropionate/trans-cinnamate dioxygenase ferredoxin component
MEEWLLACHADDIEEEDVLRVKLAGQTIPESTFHATDGLCTHEHAELADGLVMGDVIECPKHNGRFNYKTGEAKRAPARVALRTYPVKLDDGQVFVKLG